MRTVKTPLLKRMAHRFSDSCYQHATGFLLGVSGGVDSMVLLDVFVRLKGVHGKSVRVIYFKHQTGDFSELCSGLVQKKCAENLVDFQVITVSRDGGNFEFETADFRRSHLINHLRPGELVCLGHHRRDLFETTLLSLLRGSGPHAALGFTHRSGQILRPFWDTDRGLICEHARLAEVPHLIDPTNLDSDQFRGSVRRFIQTSAMQAHGGGEPSMVNWVNSWEKLHGQLEEAAVLLYDKYVVNGVLGWEAFHKNQPYLWPFILDRWIKEYGASSLSYRARDQVISWIEANQYRPLDMGAEQLWVDIDGLCTLPRQIYPELLVQAGKTYSWGSWQLRFSEAFLNSLGEQIYLIPATSIPEKTKDFMRRKRIPHRFRTMIPALKAGEQKWHLLELYLKSQDQLQWCWHKHFRYERTWKELLEGHRPIVR